MKKDRSKQTTPMEELKSDDLKRQTLEYYKTHPSDQLDKENEDTVFKNDSSSDEVEDDSVLDKGLSPIGQKSIHSAVIDEQNLKIEHQDKSISKWLLGTFIVIIVALLAFAEAMFVKDRPNSPIIKELNVSRVISDLRKEFSDQPALTFHVIKAVIKGVATDNPSAPGIVVILSSKVTQDVSSKFALNLVKSISKPYVSIEPNYALDANQLKKEIDISIKSNLTKNRLQAVFVNNLNRLPFEAALIFHSYCDHENAPFKRAVYVMTVTIDEEISPNSKIKDLDQLASKYLNYAWRGNDKSQVASLISRITGNVAAIVDKS